MKNFTTKWYKCSQGVLKEHIDVEVRQRYCFIITKDKKIVIVSKDYRSWQFSGGHPEDGENWQDTLKREVWEETGINIKDLMDGVVKLGYFLVTFPQEQFLQERYLLVLDSKSELLSLTPHEREDEGASIVKYVKAINLDQIGEYIPWALKSEDWNLALNHYRFVLES